jgi:hypothetical protein
MSCSTRAAASAIAVSCPRTSFEKVRTILERNDELRSGQAKVWNIEGELATARDLHSKELAESQSQITELKQ